jgi:hypothetical protein
VIELLKSYAWLLGDVVLLVVAVVELVRLNVSTQAPSSADSPDESAPRSSASDQGQK